MIIIIIIKPVNLSEKTKQINMKKHQTFQMSYIPLSILTYFPNWSPNPNTQKSLPLSLYFAFIQYFFSHFHFLSPPSLTLSLFPSPLSSLVILLNHYRGPSLLVRLSHPSLRPRLPSIFLPPHSLSHAALSSHF